MPKLLVAVTPLMIDHYRRYGDLLFFDNYRTMKSDGSYMTAGHFSINDNNTRTLLAGTVIYSTLGV